MKSIFDDSSIFTKKSSPLTIPKYTKEGINYGIINGEKLILLITSKQFASALELIEESRKIYEEKEIDFTCVDEQGNTPLHLAVQNNNLELVEAIINAGSPLDINNCTGQSPLDASKIIGTVSIISRLESALAAEENIKKLISKALFDSSDEDNFGDVEEMFSFSMRPGFINLAKHPFMQQTPENESKTYELFDDSRRSLSGGALHSKSREKDNSLSISGDSPYDGCNFSSLEGVGSGVSAEVVGGRRVLSVPKITINNQDHVSDRLNYGDESSFEVEELMFPFDKEDDVNPVCLGDHC